MTGDQISECLLMLVSADGFDDLISSVVVAAIKRVKGIILLFAIRLALFGGIGFWLKEGVNRRNSP